MNALDRLRLLRDTLPPSGSVVFTRGALSELLGESEPETHASETAADLTVEQIADRLNRKPNTVRDWIRAGKLDAYSFNGKEYRVTPAALHAYLQAQREGKQASKPAGKAANLGSWRNLRKAA